MVRMLSGDEAEGVTDVLCEAFHDYPVLRWVLRSAGSDYDRQLRRLVAFFVAARLMRRESLLGIDHDGSLGAAALVSNPGGPPSPPELGRIRDAVWTELGSGARSRYETFGRTWQPLLPTTPHIHLNMIGTRRSARGKGYGRALLEHVHEMALHDPASAGVSLTTEDPENVPLYRSFGYEMTGHARVTPDIETWVFFRRNPA